MSRSTTRAFLAALLIPLLFTSCDLLDPGSGRDRAELERSWRNWQMNGSGNYYYVQQRLCYCPPEAIAAVGISVRSGVVTERRRIEDNFDVPLQLSSLWGTVDDLFRLIEEAIDMDAASLQVTYDRRLGYPTHISIDYRTNVADDELSITSSGLILISVAGQSAIIPGIP